MKNSKSLAFAVIGLNGSTEMTFNTRKHANLLAVQLNRELDTAKQDAEDLAFCAQNGIPFQPRRYFVVEETLDK